MESNGDNAAADICGAQNRFHPIREMPFLRLLHHSRGNRATVLMSSPHSKSNTRKRRKKQVPIIIHFFSPPKIVWAETSNETEQVPSPHKIHTRISSFHMCGFDTLESGRGGTEASEVSEVRRTGDIFHPTACAFSSTQQDVRSPRVLFASPVPIDALRS